jgi:type IV pilus assembly protein PilE
MPGQPLKSRYQVNVGDKLIMIMKSKVSARRTRRDSGVTLIELIIVLVIISILSMVAYPSFMQSVRKGKRTDAYTALTRVGGNLERFFGANTTYTTDTSLLGLIHDEGTALSDNRYYVITVAAGATGIGSSYVVSASARAGNMQAGDTGCTTLTLDSLGRRTPDPTSSTCW